MLRFTLRRDPYGRLSTCSDGPPGRDVRCRVRVGMRLVSTGHAPEDRLALAVLRCAVPAHAAGLRRICRTDLLDPSWSLLLQTTYQCSPTVGEDAAIETGLGAAAVGQVGARSLWVGLGLGAPGHVGDMEVLHADDVEPSRQVGADLLRPILEAIAGTRVQLRDRHFPTQAPVGTRATPGETALEVLEPFQLAVREAGARQELTRGQGSRNCNASIHTDDPTGTGCPDRLRDRGEREVPPARPITRHAVRLRSGDRARRSEPHPANLRDENLRPLTAHLFNTDGLRTDDPEPLMQPGLAPGRPTVSACVEGFDGLVEVSQRLLLHSVRPRSQPTEHGPRLGQLAALLREPRRRSFVAGPHRPLLKGKVPYGPSVPALIYQRVLLRWSGIHPEPRHGAYPISHDRQSPMPEGRESRFSTLSNLVCPRPPR